MKKYFSAALFPLALLAAPVLAQPYVGAGVGAAKTDSNETSWKLFGGYQLSPTWGVELGYTNLGRFRGADVEAWSLAGTGTVRLNESWALIGKLGAASNHARFTGGGTRTELLVGVGMSYNFTRNTALRLEYEDFGKLSNANGGSNAHGRNLGLSVVYGF